MTERISFLGTARWRVATDIGGTFTDLVAIDAQTGAVIETKAPSTPDDFARGVLDTLARSGVAHQEIATFVHGSTIVINAITQRAGARTALVTTEGFRDALAIGRGNRPDMYNLRFHKPEPFVPRKHRFEVRERIAHDGEVVTPLSLRDLEGVATACEAARIEAIAICFINAYAHPAHEVAAAAFLRERLPEIAICASNELVREWREFERTSTTVLNAYVQPILDRYLTQLEGNLRDQALTSPLYAMLSSGGTATFSQARARPVHLVESGPAGGIIGAASLCAHIGEPNVITLDIGGTTAKCSLIDSGEVKISGDYRLEWTPTSPGYPVRAPVVDIIEIGAGGGSVAWFDDGGALRVGPRSVGSMPGPACYGKGGIEPTVTDAMVITGAIDALHRITDDLALDPSLARAAFTPIATRLGVTIEEAAAGVLRIVDEATVDALKLVSVRRGYDPRDFVLVAFGGGGPLHAAKLGHELGVKRIIIPPRSGTFSAWGMLMADPRVDIVRTSVTLLDALTPDRLAATFDDLKTDALRALADQGYDPSLTVTFRSLIDARYKGQEHTVRIDAPIGGTTDDLHAAFHHAHARAYTFALPEAAVEVVNLRLIATIPLPRHDAIPSTSEAPVSAHDPTPSRWREIDFGHGAKVPTAIFARATLPAGFRAAGPAAVEEPSSTSLIGPDQEFSVDRFGNLVIIDSEGERPA